MKRQATRAWDLERYIRALAKRREVLTVELVTAAGDEIEPLEDELIRINHELARLGAPTGDA